MPPLCTVGFGIANGRWDMSLGAFYLFVINGVFIAASTLAVASVLRLPSRGKTDAATRSRHRLMMGLGLVVVVIPSVWLGYRFVQQEVFGNAASSVGRELLTDNRVLAFDIDASRHTLQLTTLGGGDPEALRRKARALLAQQGVTRADIVLRHAGDDPLDVQGLRRDLNEELKRALVVQVQQTDAKVQALERQVAAALAATPPPPIAPDSTLVLDERQLTDEIRAQVPFVRAAYLAQPLGASGDPTATPAIVVVDVPHPLGAGERRRLLAVRLDRPTVTVVDHLTHGNPRQ